MGEPCELTVGKLVVHSAETSSQGDRDMNSILQVYQSVKPAEAPADGIPIDEADNTFNPISFSKQPLRTRRNQQYDPDRQMDQNIHRAKVARSEAAMLSETLAYTSAETVESNDIVKVHRMCSYVFSKLMSIAGILSENHKLATMDQ